MFSEYVVYIGTHTKSESIASVNCSRLFSPVLFGDGWGLCSPASGEISSDAAEITDSD